MSSEYQDGICMMCHKSPIEVKRVNINLIENVEFFCCRACEGKLVNFIRKESGRKVYEAVQKRKEKRNEK